MTKNIILKILFAKILKTNFETFVEIFQDVLNFDGNFGFASQNGNDCVEFVNWLPILSTSVYKDKCARTVEESTLIGINVNPQDPYFEYFGFFSNIDKSTILIENRYNEITTSSYGLKHVFEHVSLAELLKKYKSYNGDKRRFLVNYFIKNEATGKHFGYYGDTSDDD